MLTYDFEKGDGPLYEKVYRNIKKDILSGVLKPGEKLPSKRAFAKNSGLSVTTIENGFEQLISEGYIYTSAKRGYYVADIINTASSLGQPPVLADIHLPANESAYEVDLSNNQVNPIKFPFSIWARLLRETVSNRERELLIPSATGGIYELRRAIAEHLKSFRGMLVDPNQIVVGAGTEYLYGLLIQLLGNERTYCIENPGYKKIARIYEQYGISCSYASMDESGITLDSLASNAAQIVHISPAHHFPTGITMPAARRYELLKWASEDEERYIIEDDYDSEFRLAGKPIPTLFGIDSSDRVIYMNTFSKSLASTIRISYMVLPVHLINSFYERLSFYACTVSNFEQYTLAEFIERGYFEKHINRMRLYYARQRRQVLDILSRSSLRELCTVLENASGLHFLLKLETELSDASLKKRLSEAGINVRTLSEFYFEEGMGDNHTILVNYSNINVEKLYSAFENIYKIIS